MKTIFKKILNILYFFPIPVTILIAILLFTIPFGFLKPFGIFFIILTPFFIRLKRRNKYYNREFNKENISTRNNINNKYYEDLKACEDILNKIKNYQSNKNIDIYIKKIYSTLQKELIKAKKISKKINIINDILTSPYWNIEKINEKIQYEISNGGNNSQKIIKLNEMKDHILKLKEKEIELNNYISDINLNFHAVYTKIALLDSEDNTNFDEIETEIQKILDYKLKISEYEKKLDDELKEFKTNYY